MEDCRIQHAQQCVQMASRESIETQLGTSFLNALKALNCHHRAMRIAVNLGHPVLEDLGFRAEGLGFRVGNSGCGLWVKGSAESGVLLVFFWVDYRLHATCNPNYQQFNHPKNQSVHPIKRQAMWLTGKRPKKAIPKPLNPKTWVIPPYNNCYHKG